MDSDGDIDILSTYVGQTDDGRIIWYENDGSGNFSSRQAISSVVFNPRAVYAADLDNDGDMDVLSDSANDYRIAWYENDGSGNFGAQQIISNYVANPRAISAADLDNDGDIDVLSASYGDDKIAWYKNDGNGNFGSQQLITFSLASGIRHVYAADLDNDGNIDVLSASEEDNKIAWYKNNGNGGFGNQQIITTDANKAMYVYAADLDNDDDIDVLSSSYDDDKIAWYKMTAMVGLVTNKSSLRLPTIHILFLLPIWIMMAI
ncbi:MAG: VCBS repeat-containing protein [Sphingobacteriales bacterium]|nr:VCBS repeat-containing protein [Sphingobacteriales bacterium]